MPDVRPRRPIPLLGAAASGSTRGCAGLADGHLISSEIFILHGPAVVAGYGFTAEPDSLFLISRESGEVMDRVALDCAHDYLEMNGDGLTVVTTSRVYEFDLRAR